MKLATTTAAFTAVTIGAAMITIPAMAQSAGTGARPTPARTSAALPQTQSGPQRSFQEQGRAATAGETAPVTSPQRTAIPKK
jgi:hypothetical protein